MKLLLSDWLVVLAAVLFVTAHFITNAVVMKEADLIGNTKDAAALTQQSEANPLFAMLINVWKVRLIYALIIVPSLVFASYAVVRKRLAKQPEHHWLLELISFTIFFVALTNILNDAAILIGVMLK